MEKKNREVERLLEYQPEFDESSGRYQRASRRYPVLRDTFSTTTSPERNQPQHRATPRPQRRRPSTPEPEEDQDDNSEADLGNISFNSDIYTTPVQERFSPNLTPRLNPPLNFDNLSLPDSPVSTSSSTPLASNLTTALTPQEAETETDTTLQPPSTPSKGIFTKLLNAKTPAKRFFKSIKDKFSPPKTKNKSSTVLPSSNKNKPSAKPLTKAKSLTNFPFAFTADRKHKRSSSVPPKMTNDTLSFEEKVALLKIFPRYDGRGDVRQFMSVFNHHANSVGLTAKQALDLFKTCLDGKASEVFDKLPKIEQGKSREWKEWVDLFAQGLAKPTTTSASKEELNARRRRKDEELEKYMEEIQKLVHRSYPTKHKYSDEHRKLQTISHFIQGLDTKLKKTMLKESDTFTEPEEALARANTLEVINKQMKKEDFKDAVADATINFLQMSRQQNNMDDPDDEAAINFTQFQQNQGQRMPNNSFNNSQMSSQRDNFNNRDNNFNQQQQYPNNSRSRDDNCNYQQQFNDGRRGNTNFNRNFGNNGRYGQQQYNDRNGNGFQQQQYNNRNGYGQQQYGNGPRQLGNNNFGQSSRPFNSSQQRGGNNQRFQARRGRGNRGGYRINTIQTAPATTSTSTGSIPPAYYLTILALSAMFLSTNGQQLQICYQNAPATMIEPPTTINCTVPRAAVIEPVEVELFVKRRIPATADAIRCTTTVTTQCKTYAAFTEVDGRQFGKPLTTSARKCRLLAEEHLHEKEYRSKEVSKPERKFFGESCDPATNVILQKGTIALTPSGKLISDLSHLHGCETTKDFCVMDTETIIWTSFNKTQLCPYVSAGTYHGLMAWPQEDDPELIYVVLESLQAAFMFSNEELDKEVKKCVPKDSFQMKNDAIIKFKKKKPLLKKKLWMKQKQKREVVKHVQKVKENDTKPINETLKHVNKINETEHQKKMETAAATKPAATKSTTTTTTTTTNPPMSTMKNTVTAQSTSTTTPKATTTSTSTTTTIPQTKPPVKTTRKAKTTTTTTTTTPVPKTITAEQDEDSGYDTTDEDEQVQQAGKHVGKDNAVKHVQDNIEELKKVYKDTDEKERGRRYETYADMDSSQGNDKTEQKLKAEKKVSKLKEPQDEQQVNGEKSQKAESNEKTIAEPSEIQNAESTESTEDGQEKDESSTTPLKTKSVDDIINSRLNFLEEQTLINNNKNFGTLWSHICSIHNRQTDFIRTIIAIDPTVGCRIWLGRSDISARHAGQALEIKRCTPIFAEKIIWSRMINQTCYRDIPVLYNNRTYFLKDGTSDLTTSSEYIDCAHRPVSVYKDESGQWKSDLGQTHVLEMPHDSSWHWENHPIQFEAPTPYQDENEAIVQEQQILWAYSKRINNMVLTFPEEEQINTKFSWVTKVAANMVNKTSEFATNLQSQNPLSWWNELKEMATDIKFILITVLSLIGFVGLLIYFYPWLAPCINRCFQARSRRRTRGQRRLSKNGAPVNVVEMEKLEPYNFDYIPPIYHCDLNNGTLPFIDVTINGEKCEALLDSGAAVTVISHQIGQRLCKRISKDMKSGRATNGSAVKFTGRTTIELQMASKTIRTEVVIAANGHCPVDIIIGYDVCRKVGAKLDFGSKKLTVLGETVPINALFSCDVQRRTIERNKAILAEMTTIERGDNFLYAYATAPLKAGTTWLTTQAARFSIKGLIVGATLISATHSQKVPIRIYNATNTSITLHPGTIIAEMEQIHPFTKAAEPPGINILLEDQQYVPPEADISNELPLFPQPDLDNVTFLMNNLKLSDSILSATGKKELRNIIKKHQYAFVGSDGRIGCYRGPIEHSITLINTDKFIAERPRRIPPALQPIVQAQVKDMLEQAIIRPSNSPFCSPIVMVRKADKVSYRMAVDYRRLNSETKKQSNFLPLITDIVDKVSGKEFYTSIDLQSGFHQVRMKEADIHKTAFAVNSDQYEFLRLPFGLTGAPSTFQSMMNQIKREIKATIFVYMDDVVLVSATEEDHLRDIEELLMVMERNGVKLRLEKCKFGLRELKYLGLLISKEGIRPDPANVEKVKQFKPPSSLTELRSFIGAVSFFRRFINNFAGIMAPLHQLTTKGESVKQNWSSEHQTAFDTIIEKLVTAPVLKPPVFGKNFEIHTDASKESAAAVLLQADENGHLHPISFFSRKMNQAERGYCSIELEALAVVAALKEWRPYIEGSGTTIIRTDSSVCCSMMKNRNLQGRLAKFQLVIQAFDVQFVHKAGKENKLCDYMSRYVNAITLRSGRTLASSIPLADVITEQQKDYADLIDAIKYKKLPADAEQRKAVEFKIKNLKMRNNAIYFFEPESPELRLLIPYNLRSKIIQEFHNNALQGAHLGQQKTLEKMRLRVFWPNMIMDIKETIRCCEECQKNKIMPGDKVPEPTNAIATPEHPFDRLHIDIMGPVVKSADGMRYVLVVIDAFSKWTIAVPMPDQTSQTVAQKFIDYVLTQHGSCNSITTDNGKQFCCSVFRELAEVYGFQHNTTTPYHQSANGQVERQMLTLASMIRGTVSLAGVEWPELLQQVCFAYNSSVQTSTKQSPFFVLHGRDPLLPSDVALKIPARTVNPDLSTFVQDISFNIQNAYRLVKENMEVAQVEYTRSADTTRNAAEKNLKIGQLVLHVVERRKKFQPKWKGPFRIICIQRPNLMLKELSENAVPFKTHLNKVKLFHESYVLPLREIPANIPQAVLESDSDEEDEVTTPAKDTEADNDPTEDAAEPEPSLPL